MRKDFVKMPDWFPGGLPGYKYWGSQMSVYMRPAPRLRHILRYRFQPKWYVKWKARKFVREFFQGMGTVIEMKGTDRRISGK